MQQESPSTQRTRARRSSSCGIVSSSGASTCSLWCPSRSGASCPTSRRPFRFARASHATPQQAAAGSARAHRLPRGMGRIRLGTGSQMWRSSSAGHILRRHVSRSPSRTIIRAHCTTSFRSFAKRACWGTPWTDFGNHPIKIPSSRYAVECAHVLSKNGKGSSTSIATITVAANRNKMPLELIPRGGEFLFTTLTYGEEELLLPPTFRCALPASKRRRVSWQTPTQT